MKKYIPDQMIRQSRLIAFFETWNESEKEQLITQLNRLIKDKGKIWEKYLKTILVIFKKIW
jgi:hypothetical protein